MELEETPGKEDVKLPEARRSEAAAALGDHCRVGSRQPQRLGRLCMSIMMPVTTTTTVTTQISTSKKICSTSNSELDSPHTSAKLAQRTQIAVSLRLEDPFGSTKI
mmetsp:Transcript_64131/g.102133  ORF Transcript_64131/g.102133 Transcript_64131/m.102133 type:complete len:106 (-) Transcript_64131:391-708(-)